MDKSKRVARPHNGTSPRHERSEFLTPAAT